MRRTIFLHVDGRRPDVERAELEKALAHIAEKLRVHVVDIRFDEREAALAAALVLADVETHDVRHLKLPCARTVGDALRQKLGGHMLGRFCERGEDSGARRRRQLLLRASVIRREKAQQLRRRRRGHHHETVLRVHGAAARIDGRDEDLLDFEIVEADRRADDIDDGIDGADLVEMHVLERHAVHLALRLREGAENLEACFLNLCRKRGAL